MNLKYTFNKSKINEFFSFDVSDFINHWKYVYKPKYNFNMYFRVLAYKNNLLKLINSKSIIFIFSFFLLLIAISIFKQGLISEDKIFKINFF